MSAVGGQQARQEPQPGVKRPVLESIRQMRTLVPPINRRTGARQGAWPAAQLPNFILPMPNPTLAFNVADNSLGDISPEDFLGMHSWVVLFAPHLFWPGLVQVSCPLCARRATPHGWSTSVRRVAGLYGVWYVNGARYICNDCPGELALGRARQIAVAAASAAAAAAARARLHHLLR